MSWQVPRIWDEGDVWIIGGGPSLVKQFEIPDLVVQEVLAGTSPPSVYSPYMKCIHDKHVIGINAAYLIGDWIDMVFFGDSGFFNQHKARLAVFPGLKVSCHPQVEKCNWVKYTPRDGTHARGISGNPRMVSWNGNSGAAAISIAAHAGAKRIILLGFDMKLGENNVQHWHGLYRTNGVRDITGRKLAGLPFQRHLVGFTSIAKEAEARGIKIINCCPDSALVVFPRCCLKDLL